MHRLYVSLSYSCIVVAVLLMSMTTAHSVDIQFGNDQTHYVTTSLNQLIDFDTDTELPEPTPVMDATFLESVTLHHTYPFVVQVTDFLSAAPSLYLHDIFVPPQA